jgi:hypothetical protein
MKRQDYFPSQIGNQITWLHNFKIKLPQHATAMALDPAAVTAILLDVDNALYGLEKYRAALGPASTSCYQCVEDALYGESGGVMWAGFTPPDEPPAAVPNGCMNRVFDYISGKIKTSAAYKASPMIGEDLGTEGAEEAVPNPATTVPDFDLRLTSGGKLEVVWKKRPFDGVKLEFDRGAAGPFSDVDLRPNYTLNWLPAAGTSAIVKARLRFIYKGEDFGNWSEWKSFTLTGA